MKTSELSGAALDWAVHQAWCEGACHDEPFPSYSTNWAQGGPIIEREKINHAWLTKQDLGMEPEHYCVAHSDGSYARYGPTPLIAAMRCYVASKLGDEVNVPKELA
jgi:hypothetical protein